MTNIVLCPHCKTKRTVKSRNKFFRCCGVLNSVEDNLLGQGVKRYEVRKTVPTSKPQVIEEDRIEVEIV